MSKIDLDQVSQTSIVKLTASEATAYVKGDRLIDDNETLSSAIRLATEEIDEGRSEIEYIIIAVAKDELIEGKEAVKA